MGRGFLRLMIRWALLGRKFHLNAFRKYTCQSLVVAGWLIVIASLLFLITADPWQHFKEDFIFVWLARLMLAVSSALILWNCSSVLYEVYKARRQGRHWAMLLQKSQIGVAVERPHHPVEGLSCGIALTLAVLLALDEASPVSDRQSLLWREFFSQLKLCAPNWAVIGEAQSGGKVGAVEAIAHKIAAALQHGKITDLITPNQKDEIEAALTKERIIDLIERDQMEVSNWPRVLVRKQPNRQTVQDQTPASESATNVRSIRVPAAQAASSSKLRLRPFGSMAKLCLTIGCFEKETLMAVLSIVSQGSLVLIAFLGAYNLRQITLFPKYTTEAAWQENVEGASIEVSISTAYPELFAAKFTSCYWASRPSEQFLPVPGIPSKGYVHVKLEKLESAPPGCDFHDGSVEIQRLRGFLWRALPPRHITRVPLWYFASSWTEQLQKAAAAGSGTGVQPDVPGSRYEQPK